jgi:hypothetical protein
MVGVLGLVTVGIIGYNVFAKKKVPIVLTIPIPNVPIK